MVYLFKPIFIENNNTIWNFQQCAVKLFFPLSVPNSQCLSRMRIENGIETAEDILMKLSTIMFGK